jgi:hypothetical protein
MMKASCQLAFLSMAEMGEMGADKRMRNFATRLASCDWTTTTKFNH